MSKSNWFGDDDQNGNFSKGKQDTFDPTKRYIGIRLQQGVPLLDRDWNELEDIRRYEEQMLRKWYIGNGSPDDGFRIMPLVEAGDDFKIKAGRYLVDGFEVVNDHKDGFILYSAQEDGEPDTEKISELEEFQVYLDVWIEEVSKKIDTALANEDDVKMETCLRHKLKWRVRVGRIQRSKAHHHSYLLAEISRDNSKDPIKEANITDFRRTGLALFLLRDKLVTNQLADDLHRHSKLVARNGSLDPALSVDNSGNVGIGTTNPQDKLDVYGAIRFNGNPERRIYSDSRAGSNAIVLKGLWDELEVKGRVIDWTGSNLHIGYQNDHSENGVYIGGEGKLKFVQINHAAQTDAINTDTIGLELQSSDGGGVIYGHDINHSIFFRRGRDGAINVTDYHQFGTHRFFTDGGVQNQKERMRITNNGYVGIGTANPGSMLEVAGQVSIFRETVGYNAGVLNIGRERSADNFWHITHRSANNDNLEIYKREPGNWIGPFFTIDKSGNVTIKGNLGTHGYPPTPIHHDWGGGVHTWDIEVEGTIWARNHWDLAENYLSDIDLEPGDVVCLDEHKDRIVLSKKPNDISVLGVVSTEPGMILNADCETDDAKAFPIALCGRVPCKIIDENGSVKRGDLLTSSSTPGHAMKATPLKIGDEYFFRTGTIIGKALESHESGKGTIDIWRIQS